MSPIPNLDFLNFAAGAGDYNEDSADGNRQQYGSRRPRGTFHSLHIPFW